MNILSLDASFADAYEILVNEEPLTCAKSGVVFPAVPSPDGAIVDVRSPLFTSLPRALSIRVSFPGVCGSDASQCSQAEQEVRQSHLLGLLLCRCRILLIWSRWLCQGQRGSAYQTRGTSGTYRKTTLRSRRRGKIQQDIRIVSTDDP